MKFGLFNALIVLLTSCNSLSNDSLPSNQADNTKNTYDTTLFLFSDSTYRLNFHVFDTKEFSEEKNNSLVTFYITRQDRIIRVFQDSFYCMYPTIEHQDFNNDNIKDLLLFNSTGARANPTYHLYVIDTIKHELSYIQGFENLPNPDLDSMNNIISSAAYAGTDIIWSFYRINTKNNLVDLKHGFTSDLGDSIKYEHAIQEILKKEN